MSADLSNHPDAAKVGECRWCGRVITRTREGLWSDNLRSQPTVCFGAIDFRHVPRLCSRAIHVIHPDDGARCLRCEKREDER